MMNYMETMLKQTISVDQFIDWWLLLHRSTLLLSPYASVRCHCFLSFFFFQGKLQCYIINKLIQGRSLKWPSSKPQKKKKSSRGDRRERTKKEPTLFSVLVSRQLFFYICKIKAECRWMMGLLISFIFIFPCRRLPFILSVFGVVE